MWFHAETGEVTGDGEGGLPLGLDAGAQYTPVQIELTPGDLLLFYTDGIIEAMDADERQYGTECLAERVRSGARGELSRLLDDVRADLEQHLAGRQPTDDVTLLAVKLTAPAAEYEI